MTIEDRPADVKLPAINKAPSYRRVANLVEQEIMAGRIRPGELLPTEADLSTQLGVHRSTVREGIRSLENSGLVRRVGGKRLMVSIPDSHSVAWSTTRAMGLRKVSFNELWEVQMEIEPFSAQLAAERINPKTAVELSNSLHRIENDLDNDQAVIDHDVEFHRIIAKSGENRVLLLSSEPINALLHFATLDLYRRVPQARHRLLEAHKNIADAVISHDPARAREWMAKHLRDFKRGYLVAGIDLDAPINFDPEAMAREYETRDNPAGIEQL